MRRAALPLALPFAAALCLLAGAAPAAEKPAAKAEAKPKTELGTFAVTHENDLFAGTDQHYTSGLRLSWLSPEGGNVWEPLGMAQGALQAIA